MKARSSNIHVLLIGTGIALLLILGIIWYQSSRPPQLSRVYPKIASPGEILVLEGQFFGSDRGSAQIFLAGSRVTQSRILEWTNSRISLRVPDSVESGLIMVQTNNGQSNGMLFANRAQVPRVNQSTLTNPEVEDTLEVLPSGRNSFKRGSLITLRNPQIPDIQGNGGVTLADGMGDLRSIATESWSYGEITFYLPSWAASGELIVTLPGIVERKLGVPLVVDPGISPRETGHLSWKLQYGLDFQVQGTGLQERLAVQIPLPPVRAYQRVHETIVTPNDWEAGWVRTRQINEDSDKRIFLGLGLKQEQQFKIIAAVSGTSIGLVYEINPGQIETDYKGFLPEVIGLDVLDQTTHPEGAIEDLLAQAVSIQGRQTNPYRKALLVFDWIIEMLEPGTPGTGFSLSGDKMQAMLNGTMNSPTEPRSFVASSRDYAAVAVDLLRASGIPARMLDGFVLLSFNHLVPHSWLEYFLPGVGWIPADPALADNMLVNQGFLPDNPGEYYRQGIDSNHILLSIETPWFKETIEKQAFNVVSLPGIAKTMSAQFYYSQGVILNNPRWTVPYITF